MKYQSTKVIELGSCAFRQWRASHSHCKFLHGYQLISKFWFGGSALDEKNWLVDFGGLKVLKAKLQDIFDHTTCVAADDPELETFRELDRKGIIQLRIFDKGVGIERTAEVAFNIAQDYIREITNGRCWVEKVEVFEHEDNSATYSNPSSDFTESTSISYSFSPVADEVQTQAVVLPQPEPVPHVQRGANVGPNVSGGKGNWFSGTTWG
jgi:6-pyruvoyltetrahydropterin/6-carboxytetrahydropterin synthase